MLYYLLYLDSFSLEVDTFNTKEEALDKISWLLSKDSFLSQDKFAIIYGERIFTKVKETRSVSVTEDSDEW